MINFIGKLAVTLVAALPLIALMGFLLGCVANPQDLIPVFGVACIYDILWRALWSDSED